MREIVLAALRELNLDYSITLISGGASCNYEIVMWDKPRNSYFSVRLNWRPEVSASVVTTDIKSQLRTRLAALESGRNLPYDRKPLSIVPKTSSDSPQVA